MKYRFKEFEVDSDRYLIKHAGEPVVVNPLAFDLLVYLMKNSDRVVTREELLDRLWHDKVVTDAALDARLRDARKAVGDDGAAQGVIKTCRGRGYQFVAEIDESAMPDEAHVPSEPGAAWEDFSSSDAPSIAVLPFTNLSGDPAQDCFVDGTTNEIITGLSRVPGLFVIASNSTMTYKGQNVNISIVGREQGVSHVLEGSIQKSGDHIRVTAQLIDATSGLHVWAGRFQSRLSDIFAVQDEITQKVMTELQVKLVTGEYARPWSAGTRNLDAWELLLQARTRMTSFARDDCLIARQLLKQVLELDANYSTAWVMLGYICWMESNWGWTADMADSLDRAREYAQKALAIEPDNPDAHALFGQIHLVRGDHAKAIAMTKKAVNLAPGDSRMNGLLGNVLIDAGRIREGIQRMRLAIRLCPNPLPWYLLVLGAGLHLANENPEAIDMLEKAVANMPESILPRLWLVSALVELDRLDDASILLKEVLDLDPGFSALSWADSFKSKTHKRLRKNVLAVGFRN
jgi:TolB-like protein/Tfp pilus assembly protein PilF